MSRRLSILALAAILLPALIVAVLGWVSLRGAPVPRILIVDDDPTTRTVDTHVLRLRRKSRPAALHPDGARTGLQVRRAVRVLNQGGFECA